MRKLSIKWQLIILCVLLVSIPVIILGTMSYSAVKQTTVAQIEDAIKENAAIMHGDLHAIYDSAYKRQQTNLRDSWEIVNDAGRFALSDETMEIAATNQMTKQTHTARIQVMTLGGERLASSYEVVDHIDDKYAATATIFQLFPEGMIRISTNVRNPDGTRATGTYLPKDSQVYQAIARGEAYYGRALVLDEWNIAAYEPIRDARGAVIGALFVGTPETEYFKPLLDEYAKHEIGKTGYLYILDTKGNYVLSYKRQRDGENIYEAKDSDGRFFIQEIIKLGKENPADTQSIIYYPWKNAGEAFAREKVASVMYIEEMEWVIGSSTYVDDFMGGVETMRNITITVCVVAIALGTLIAYLFAERMTRKFRLIVDQMDAVAGGDLTVRIDNADKDGDEIAQMAVSFKGMVDGLRTLITNILKNANSAAASAEELSASAEEVNASVEQVSSTIQEIAKGAQQLSKNASEAANKSKMTEESSGRGSAATNAVQQKMGTISTTTQAGADKVRGLSEKSKRIGNIIETINNISEQTNLLALNAAIEAARAGDAGRGFAVVADEVRKLAEESKKATALIAELINSIQEEIGNSVESMGQISAQVDGGAKSITEALAAFEEVPLLVNMVNKSITEISAVAEENAAGAEEVSASVEEVTSAIQQVATTAQQLSQAAGELKSLVNKFRLEAAQANR